LGLPQAQHKPKKEKTAHISARYSGKILIINLLRCSKPDVTYCISGNKAQGAFCFFLPKGEEKHKKML